MNSELLTRWTAIITNMAVVIGLVFVGLEFRNNTRAVEAERIDSILSGSLDMHAMIVENADLAELVYQSYLNPNSVSGSDLDRLQHWMLISYDNFRRALLAHESGLIDTQLYDNQRLGVGFMFSSNIGLGVIEQMTKSSMNDRAWSIIAQSAEQARTYCLNPQNPCAARYEAARKNSD